MFSSIRIDDCMECFATSIKIYNSEAMNYGKFSQLHLWTEVIAETGCLHCDNMLKLGCAMTRNHDFQIVYFSLYSLSRLVNNGNGKTEK